jgi:3-hydroxyacyl-[acyl-carrier-protein] dehydratase
MPKTIQNEEELREALKRCPEQSINAAIEYSQTQDPSLVPVIVMGIVERFVEPDVRPLVRKGDDSSRLMEDLGIDSLLMVEIVMLIEETLGISIENEELRNLRTVGDVKVYLDAKIRGLPVPTGKNLMHLEQIVAEMPHQPPFLFLQEARVNGEAAEGRYLISGDEVFLEGHFKDDPIFPASLMLEALGQLAVLYLRKTDHPEFAKVSREKIVFVSCDGVRCHRICRPGDLLQMRIELRKTHLPLVQFTGSITVNGTRVAKAEEISLSLIDGEHPELANREG